MIARNTVACLLLIVATAHAQIGDRGFLDSEIDELVHALQERLPEGWTVTRAERSPLIHLTSAEPVLQLVYARVDGGGVPTKKAFVASYLAQTYMPRERYDELRKRNEEADLELKQVIEARKAVKDPRSPEARHLANEYSRLSQSTKRRLPESHFGTKLSVTPYWIFRREPDPTYEIIEENDRTEIQKILEQATAILESYAK